MERVTGIGGVFFRAEDPARLRAWYREHLGVEGEAWGAFFRWRDDPRAATGGTVWAPFPRDTAYFGPSQAAFMISFRVKSLDAMLDQLRRGGVTVDEKVQVEPSGRFGWAMDPEGNRIELWEPGQAD